MTFARMLAFGLFCWVAISQSGCMAGDIQPYIVDYGDSLSNLTQVMTAVLNDMKTADAEAVALLNTQSGFVMRVSQAPRSIQDANNVDAFILLQQDLRDYAEAVKVLASSTNHDKIDQQANQIHESLVSINTNIPKLSKIIDPSSKLEPFDTGEPEIITTLFRAAAQTIYDYKRDNYLKQIVIKAQPLMARTTTVLRNAFKPCDELASSQDSADTYKCSPFEKIYIESLEHQAQIYTEQANSEVGNGPFEKRLAYTLKAQKAEIQRLLADQQYQRIYQSLEAHQNAHNKLVDFLTSQHHGQQQKEQVVGRVNQMIVEIKDTIAFYNSLKGAS